MYKIIINIWFIFILFINWVISFSYFSLKLPFKIHITSFLRMVIQIQLCLYKIAFFLIDDFQKGQTTSAHMVIRLEIVIENCNNNYICISYDHLQLVIKLSHLSCVPCYFRPSLHISCHKYYIRVHFIPKATCIYIRLTLNILQCQSSFKRFF